MASKKSKKNAESTVSNEGDEMLNQEMEATEASEPTYEEDSQDESQETEIRDGRRVKKGPRPVYYSLSAVSQGKLITAKLQSSVALNGTSGLTGNDFDRREALAEVTERFTVEHGCEPGNVDGPFYEVRDASGSREPRDTVNRKTGQKYKFTGVQGNGVFHGWECQVMATENEDICFIIPSKIVNLLEASGGEIKIDEKTGKQKSPQSPPPHYVKTDSIANLLWT